MNSDNDQRSGRPTQGDHNPGPQADDRTPKAPDSTQSKARAIRDKGRATVARVKAGTAGQFWSHLTAADFMTSSMNFAALGLLCGLPLFTVLAMIRGHDVAGGIITRMGLNPQAAADVKKLIAPTHASVSTLGVTGALFLLLGGIGLAASIQQWYQRVFDLPPLSGAWKGLAVQFTWLVSLVVAVIVLVQIGRDVRPGGDHVLSFILQFCASVLFWWWSLSLLLQRRLRWRQTLPTGLATGFCLTGLAVFSALLFSSSITSGVKSYGEIGVISVLLSYLIGVGVCVHLGAVFGRMWVERHEPKPTVDTFQTAAH